MGKFQFVLPSDLTAFYQGGDALPSIQICDGKPGKPVFYVSADSVVEKFQEVDLLRKTLNELAVGLEAEREKIRRLMRALSDEVTK